MVTVTYAHHSLIQGNRAGSLYGLVYTVILATIFTGLQGVEYSVSGFSISDGIYGSCFYFGTGLTYGAPFKLNTKNTPNLLEGKQCKPTLSENSVLQPYWVTGFSDAESTFSVKIAKDPSRLLGIRIIPVFSIELHIKDIEVLKKIKGFFNVGSVIVRIRNGKSTGIYSVQSLQDLAQYIIPHFNKYPLLTQKKADFLLFSWVVNLMNNKEHLTVQGLHKILSIRASMNKGLTENLKSLFPEIVEVGRPIISNQIIESPWWLIGFVDGEGCFYLKITRNNQINLVFSISQHSRDSGLFDIMKSYLGCGLIEKVPTRPNTVNFVVYKLEDVLKKMIPIFEKHSLITQKSLDFYYFKKVSFWMSNKEHLTVEGFQKILDIQQLKKNK